MTTRLVITAVVIVLATAGVLRWRVWSRSTPVEQPVDRSLLDGPRTWIVFTTPYCATCQPVIDRIADVDPEATVRVIDVAKRPDLGRRHQVRTAPTALLADANGNVRARHTTPQSILASQDRK